MQGKSKTNDSKGRTKKELQQKQLQSQKNVIEH